MALLYAPLQTRTPASIGDMELTDETGHRALMYVAAVQRGSHLVTVDELEAYVSRPERKPAVAPTPVRPRASQTPVTSAFASLMGRRLKDQLFQAYVGSASFRSGVRTASEVLGGRGTHTEYVGGSPEESVTDWLKRLHWIETRDDHTVRITRTGQAVLRHLEESRVEADTPVAVVLDPEDELVMARVMGELAAIGPGALVDAYFSVDHLLTLIRSTTIDRVLTGTSDSKKLTELEVGLGLVATPRRFEVRKSGDIHDRFVIPDNGPLWTIGTSLTGVGNKLSMMVQLSDESDFAQAIRGRFEHMWINAEVVAVLDPDAAGDDEREDDLEPEQDGAVAAEGEADSGDEGGDGSESEDEAGGVADDAAGRVPDN